MSLIERECPQGVDVAIARLQKELYLELIKCSNWCDYDSFPRIYINPKGNDNIPEVYLKSGEYKDVLFDDRKKVNSFFLADDRGNYDPKEFLWTHDVALIIQANLDKLKPKAKGRADAEVINDVKEAIRRQMWDMRFKAVITGIDKVYSSLKMSYNKEKFNSMSNFFIARFNFTLLYDNTKNSNPLK